MGDIKAVYHQVKVPDDQCSFLRFLWCEDCDTNKEIIAYDMLIADVFGGTSPSWSNFALRKTASDNRDEYTSDVTRILERNFYVDDMLKSFQTVTKAKDVIRKVKELCAKGGFNLAKFTSNNEAVLKSIPNEGRRKNVSDEALTFCKLPEDKAFGVKWNISKDTLGFQTKMTENPSTRCGLLSMLSSIYDPLGLGASFFLKVRLVIQQLCRDRRGWDKPIDEKSFYEWLKWKNNLVAMENINIPRCYKPTDFGQVVEYTLHHFSGASETGYGQASYLRMINENGDVHCCLTFGKSRVAPVKYVFIPKLELTAATLSVKVSDMLRRELGIPIASEEFWTESQVALGYISNEARQFKTLFPTMFNLLGKSQRFNNGIMYHLRVTLQIMHPEG